MQVKIHFWQNKATTYKIIKIIYNLTVTINSKQKPETKKTLKKWKSMWVKIQWKRNNTLLFYIERELDFKG